MIETPIQELKRLVTETQYNLRLLRKDIEELKEVMDDGLKSPECSVCDEPAEDITGYYACPACEYRVTEVTYKSIRLDYVCPRCYNRIMSQFVHHHGVKHNEQ